jgi:hypothetical protein
MERGAFNFPRPYGQVDEMLDIPACPCYSAPVIIEGV